MQRLDNLIIGGTRGIGQALALALQAQQESVLVTGRTVDRPDQEFYKLDLASDDLATHIQKLVANLPPVKRLIYSAGFFQELDFMAIDEASINQMLRVNFQAPFLLVQALLKKQKTLPECVVITSTSQFTPRPLESLYCSTKAGLAMLTACLHETSYVERCRVIAPSGTKTSFYRDTERDLSSFLDVETVVTAIQDSLARPASFEFVKILRNPVKIIVAEQLS